MNENELVTYFINATLTKQNFEMKAQNAYREIEHYLSKGWTIEALMKEIETFALANPQRLQYIYSLKDIIGTKKPRINLVNGIICYHNDLRKPIAPTRIRFMSSGEIIRKDADADIQQKEEYYVNDLLNYYYKRTRQKATERMITRDEGKALYLLKEFDVDEILFAIDIAEETRRQSGKHLTDLFMVQDFIERAQNGIKRKRNQERLAKVAD